MQSRRKSQAFPLRDNRYPTKAGQTTKSTMKTTKAQKNLCLLRLRFVPFVYLSRFVGRREKVTLKPGKCNSTIVFSVSELLV